MLSVGEAAALLGVGERQARRLLAAYREQGIRGVVHGNRGRRPAHSHGPSVVETIVALARDEYAGVNHTHLAELLAEREGIHIGRSTLSRLLHQAGIASPRPQKRRSKHRSRRERYPQEGMLLQIDASHHDWLQGRGPRLVLLGVIDDATGKVVSARFHESEDSRGYLLLLRDVCKRVGVPQALYSDKHAVFWPTASASLQEQLAGRRSPTQFGRAMAEAGVQLIAAHSPQAKGRIERLWGTLQDRLVSELRLANACSIEDANHFLSGFLQRFNRSFAVEPREPGLAYGPRLKAAQLNTVFCFKHERVVSKDNTVKLGQMVFQLLPGPDRLGYSKATVTIHESLDHHYSISLGDRRLRVKLVPLRKLLTPKAVPKPRPSRTPQPWTPPPTHPWRQPLNMTKSLST